MLDINQLADELAKRLGAERRGIGPKEDFRDDIAAIYFPSRERHFLLMRNPAGKLRVSLLPTFRQTDPYEISLGQSIGFVSLKKALRILAILAE